MDEEGGMCCGRPMMLAGHKEQANILMKKNRKLILDSGAKTLVTSCPICFKIFSKEYDLNIRVMHHTQYLLELNEKNKIHLKPMKTSAVYHDPCELSRDIRVYDEPRKLLGGIVNLVQPEFEKENSLCCGSSLANFTASDDIRRKIAANTYEKLNPDGAGYLVTSCPLCKKAFEKVSGVPVHDIAEMVNRSMILPEITEPAYRQKKSPAHRSMVVG